MASTSEPTASAMTQEQMTQEQMTQLFWDAIKHENAIGQRGLALFAKNEESADKCFDQAKQEINKTWGKAPTLELNITTKKLS
jgi:hypothetical protein